MNIDLGAFRLEQGGDGWWHIRACSYHQEQAVEDAGGRARRVYDQRWKTRAAAERNLKKLEDLVYPPPPSAA